MSVTFGPGITISGSGGISINLKLQSPNISTATVLSTTSTSVSFNMPVTIGHPPTRSYTVTSSPGGITATGTSSPITVSGLTSGVSYTFTVVANNVMDTSNASVASLAVTQISVSDAPTIGTAAAVINSTTATVAFTAPANNGGATITSYRATSSPGGLSNTGTTSPILVTGLTAGTAYTFTVSATNSAGTGASSSASNRIVLAVVLGSQAYVTAGSYTWIAPACVSSVSVVAVGGGAGSAYGGCSYYSAHAGGSSYFCSTSLVYASGGRLNPGDPNLVIGDGGGYGGGGGGYRGGGGGGAGGYSGDGGTSGGGCCAIVSYAGSGGGGASGANWQIFSSPPHYVSYRCNYTPAGGGGGGVGIHGQGCSGAAQGCYGNPATGGWGGLGGSHGGQGGAVQFRIVANPSPGINSQGGQGYNYGGVTAPAGACGLRQGNCTYQRTDTTSGGGGGGQPAYYGCNSPGGGAFGGGGGSTSGYGGGFGGNLAYKNTIAVTSGTGYTVVVGVGGRGGRTSQNGGYGGNGAAGAVRIVWPGNLRNFPSTCVGIDPVYAPFCAPTIGTVTTSGFVAFVPFTTTLISTGTSYIATSSPGGITSTGTTSPISVIGLSGSTTYTFNVAAVNAGGTGPASNQSNPVTTVSTAGKTPSIRYLVIGGGGGGGAGATSPGGGGGGAGGYLTTASISITACATYTVTIGGGGASTTSGGTKGCNTTLVGTGINVTAYGGGKGGTYSCCNGASGLAGGSGGGSTYGNNYGGTPVSDQGNAGGGRSAWGGAGGGGAGAVGSGACPSASYGAQMSGGSPGGAGLASNITGSCVYYAGGGGGGTGYGVGYNSYIAPGGSGGGGNGGGTPTSSSSTTGSPGCVNTGGGGGGGGINTGGAKSGGQGGKGVVIVSWSDAYVQATSTTGTVTFSHISGYYVYKFTGSGSFKI